MKRIYYLLILLSFCFVFCSCENKIGNENNKTENGNNTDSNNETNYADDVYLINELGFTLDIEVFIGGKLSKFTLIPHETIYFTTVEYTLYEGDKPNEFPGAVEYLSFLNSIDSVNVFYFAQKHTYVKSDNKIFQLFDVDDYDEKGWIIKFDETKAKQLGWEANLEDMLKGERYVDSVYLVNHLDKPINLEMHRNSLNSEYNEWYFDAGSQNFTLEPNDTIYLDTVVYHMAEGTYYQIFPGENAFKALIYCYDFVKVDYNGKQYEYTNKTDIQNLLREVNYWYIEFNEEKKKTFGWE